MSRKATSGTCNSPKLAQPNYSFQGLMIMDQKFFQALAAFLSVHRASLDIQTLELLEFIGGVVLRYTIDAARWGLFPRVPEQQLLLGMEGLLEVHGFLC